MKNILSTLCTLLITCSAIAETYYVRKDGSNHNLGTSNTAKGAWLTLNHAFDNIIGGDTLLINDGEYLVEPISLEEIHGKEGAPTVIASINNWGAKIRLKNNPEEGNVIEAKACSYLEFDGLEVFAQAPNKGTGIEASRGSHHITIKNCYVHDCGCGGISGRGSDYITIENNVVRHNATRSKWNCSGISLLLAKNYDDKSGYHMIIRGNVSFENECRFPFEHGGYDVPTDGNGIILDLFNNGIENEEGEVGGYRASTLIENNLSFNNGGRGINIFRSDNVTVRNNTCWYNLSVLSENGAGHGEIEAFEAKNLEIHNNIFAQNGSLKTKAVHLHEYGDTGSIVINNYIVGNEHYWPEPKGTKENIVLKAEDKDLVGFINATTEISFISKDDFKQFFGLTKSSPAVDRANKKQAPKIDIDGKTRKKPDIGCYEN